MNTRKALLEEKERLLNQIKYHEHRIEDLLNKPKPASYCNNSESSESDDDFHMPDITPRLPQMKEQRHLLTTCLQATQELTNLNVIQAEYNILPEPPLKFDNKGNEAGCWREVTAECRIDLVPFSITFYCYKPNQMFGATSYYQLNVMPVKSTHEKELSKSVLKNITKPSNAVEVIRSYAAAYRSRRTTLAALVENFSNNLYIQQLEEGGYVIKCSQILQLTWNVENKWSPVSPFHHKLRFDLEYMDEVHLKTITQLHKKISDPTINTDERTALLSKIIYICLQLKDTLNETLESDTESLRREKTILEDEEHKEAEEALAEVPEVQETEGRSHTEVGRSNAEDGRSNAEDGRNNAEDGRSNAEDGRSNAEVEQSGKEAERNVALENNDQQLMAPPKSLPKKIKPKGKENKGEIRKTKRPAEENNAVASKKAKTDDKKVNSNNKNEPQTSKTVSEQASKKPAEKTVNTTKKTDSNNQNVPKKTVNDKGAKKIIDNSSKNSKSTENKPKLQQKDNAIEKVDENNKQNPEKGTKNIKATEKIAKKTEITNKGESNKDLPKKLTKTVKEPKDTAKLPKNQTNKAIEKNVATNSNTKETNINNKPKTVKENVVKPKVFAKKSSAGTKNAKISPKPSPLHIDNNPKDAIASKTSLNPKKTPQNAVKNKIGATQSQTNSAKKPKIVEKDPNNMKTRPSSTNTALKAVKQGDKQTDKGANEQKNTNQTKKVPNKTSLTKKSMDVVKKTQNEIKTARKSDKSMFKTIKSHAKTGSITTKIPRLMKTSVAKTIT